MSVRNAGATHVTQISLEAWAAVRYTDPPIPRKRLQRWARDGWIYPMPEKLGKEYRVHPNAVFIGRDITKAAEYDSAAA